MPRQLRTRAQLTEPSKPPPRQTMSDRVRRGITKQRRNFETSPTPSNTITVAREASSSPSGGAKSIRIVLKMPPSKLREVTLGEGAKAVASKSRDPSLENSGAAGGPRSSRAKRAVVLESGSEDEQEDDEVDAIGEDEEDAAGEDDDEEMEDGEGEEEDDEEEDEEEDAEGEEDDEEEEDEEEDEEDADGDVDVDMEDAEPPPPPVIQRTGPSSNPKVTITPAPTKGQVKSVEAKEIQMARSAGSEEDLSDLPEEEDAEGEDVAEDEAMADADEDAEGDSDNDMSRDGTPDLTKLTKRQRGRMGDEGTEHFMALNMEPQTKLHLTDEQRALRRAEMARRRKNLSEKRNEEEKMDTINRLLKKQLPKRRGKASKEEMAAGAETPDVQITQQDEPEPLAEPGFIRWVSNADGCRIGLPIEWKDKAAASAFGHGNWRMIEEIET